MATNTTKVVALSLSQFIMTLVSVVSGMVFTRYLSILDYATYLQTFLAYDFVIPLLTLGLPSALYYFLPKEQDQKGIIIDNLLLLFLSGSIFTCFLLLGGTNLLAQRFENPNLLHTLKWMYFYPLYTIPVVLNAILVVQDRVRTNAIYNVITGIILTGSIILAALFSGGYSAPILVRIILPVFFFPVSLYLSFKYVTGRWRFPQISSMWKILKFAIPLGLSTICGTLTLQISNIIVSLFCSPEQYAVYATGAKEVPLVSIITGSISIVIMAEMSKKCKEGRKQDALELFRKAATIGGCFLVPLMVILLIYANDFIDVLYTSKYSDSIIPFRIYLFFLPIRIVFYGAAFIALGRAKAILYRSILELVITTVLAYLFVKLFGYNGAALASITTLYVWSIPYNLRTLGKSFGCKATYILPFDKLGKILIIAILAGGISSICLLLNVSSFIRLLCGGGIGGIIYLVLAYRYIPEFRYWILLKVNKLHIGRL